MVLRTVVSVLEQDWPLRRLVVVVSDDGHDPRLRAALRRTPGPLPLPAAPLRPGPRRRRQGGKPQRPPWPCCDRVHPDIVYVETRDADDELGSNRFLREVVGQLQADERLAFVQTIKEAQVSAGDPFNNRESGFYRGQMLSRNAANAVFPCGSGVVWRRTALRGHRRVPHLEPRRGPPVRPRGAVPGVARHVPTDRRRRRPALPRRRAQRLQAARHMGHRHRPTHRLARPRRPAAPPTSPLRRHADGLPQRLHRVRLRPQRRLRRPRRRAAGRQRLGLRQPRPPHGARHRGLAPRRQRPLQRPARATATPHPSPVADAHHVDGPSPDLHQGHPAGAARRTQPQTRLPDHPQAPRRALALAPHPAPDHAPPRRGLRHDLRPPLRHPSRPSASSPAPSTGADSTSCSSPASSAEAGTASPRRPPPSTTTPPPPSPRSSRRAPPNRPRPPDRRRSAAPKLNCDGAESPPQSRLACEKAGSQPPESEPSLSVDHMRAGWRSCRWKSEHRHDTAHAEVSCGTGYSVIWRHQTGKSGSPSTAQARLRSRWQVATSDQQWEMMIGTCRLTLRMQGGGGQSLHSPVVRPGPEPFRGPWLWVRRSNTARGSLMAPNLQALVRQSMGRTVCVGTMPSPRASSPR